MAFLFLAQQYFIVLNVLGVILVLLAALCIVIMCLYTSCQHRHVAFCFYNLIAWFTLTGIYICVLDRSNRIFLSQLSTVCSVAVLIPFAPWLKECALVVLHCNCHVSVIVTFVFVVFRRFFSTPQRRLCFFGASGAFHVAASASFGFVAYSKMLPLKTLHSAVLENNGYSAATTRCSSFSAFDWPTAVVVVYSILLAVFLLLMVAVQRETTDKRAIVCALTFLVINVFAFSTVPILVGIIAYSCGNISLLVIVLRSYEILQCSQAIGCSLIVLLSIKEYRSNLLGWMPWKRFQRAVGPQT